MKMYFAKILLLFKILFGISEAAKILAVFPAPSFSHQVVFRALTQELAKRGHEVVVITADPAYPKGRSPPNLTEIDVHDISYKHMDIFYLLPTGQKENLRGLVRGSFQLWLRVTEEQFKLVEVQRITQKQTKEFDLLLLAACVRPALAFTHIFKLPTILVSSSGPHEMNNHAMGIPTHPLRHPSFFHQKLYNLTLWEEFKQIYEYYDIQNIIESQEEEENKLLKQYFPSIPPLSELANNVDMLFLNTNPIWEDNRPVPSSVIYMGGLHQKPQKELTEELKSYLDSSKAGVIYVSFGTNVKPSSISSTVLKSFVNVFAKLPYNVLWKFDKNEIPGLSSNVKLSSWFPQADLLRHPNVKLFITQGGLQSTDEAITAGVPLIGVPMLADQWFNTEKYEYHKIGLQLMLEMIDEERLYSAIRTVIEDESYRHNIVRLRSLMRDQPQSPLERAVWWTEHVLRHGGGPHLRAPAANISWRHFLEMDVVLTILSGFLMSTALLVLSLRYFFKAITIYFSYLAQPSRHVSTDT